MRLKGDNAMKKYITSLALAFLVFSMMGVSHAVTLNMSNLNGQINVNTATKEELVMVPFITDTVAQNIINSRNSHGPFKSLHDLLIVKGVDKKLLDEVGLYLKTDGVTTIRLDNDD
jgi:competence ComEA-like helix-hairpin-helix protein